MVGSCGCRGGLFGDNSYTLPLVLGVSTKLIALSEKKASFPNDRVGELVGTETRRSLMRASLPLTATAVASWAAVS